MLSDMNEDIAHISKEMSTVVEWLRPLVGI